ncbi:hypothetical protein TNCV_4497851 [Trichonephila clavipes]|nr:hypothetical protein TNCV_4497851 [Trichonephila clavipes]
MEATLKVIESSESSIVAEAESQEPRKGTGMKIPRDSNLANMVAKVASLAAKNNANLALPQRFRQVFIESLL